MNVTIQLQKVPPGTYEVKVTVTDKAGNASVKPQTITR